MHQRRCTACGGGPAVDVDGIGTAASNASAALHSRAASGLAAELASALERAGGGRRGSGQGASQGLGSGESSLEPLLGALAAALACGVALFRGVGGAAAPQLAASWGDGSPLAGAIPMPRLCTELGVGALVRTKIQHGAAPACKMSALCCQDAKQAQGANMPAFVGAVLSACIASLWLTSTTCMHVD